MKKRAFPQYLFLALVLLPAIWIQAGNTMHLIHLLQKAPEMPESPFAIKTATREIGSGPYRDDQLLAIGGKPFNNPRQLEQMVDSMRPGEPLTVLLSEPGGRAIERKIMLPPMAPKNGLDLATTVLSITLDGFIPILALALGSIVVLLRPRDANAWLLLFLLIGFSEVARAHSWRGPYPDLTFVWYAFGVGTWPIFMMLFGIYFPERLAADRRLPWVKYLVLVPCALCPLILWTIAGTWLHNVNASMAWRDLFMKLSAAQSIISMAAISTFFAGVGAKSGTSTSPDTRRRLRILWLGSTVSLTPMFCLVLYSLARHRDVLDGVPFAVVVPVLMALLLFPVTLAYVIVIERAMDLSFVLRQSVQYGLFKAGLWTLRAGLVIALGYYLRTGSTRTWPAQIGGVAAALLVMRRGGATRASQWIDKRFFREAYDSEHVLSDLAVQVGQFLEIPPLLDTVARRLSNTLHVSEITVLLRHGGRLESAWSGRSGQALSLPSDNGIARLLREQGQPLQVFLEPPSPWLGKLNTVELQAIDVMRSQLLLAMPGKDQLAGILSLGSKRSEVPYSPTDIRLLQTVAAQVGLGVENSRLAESLANEAAQRERLNREVEIAREVQQRLLPQSFPPVRGVEYSGYCRPALVVGGDYYDFLQLPNGAFGIAIGDVSGKGIAASLLMASLQASLRGQTIVDLHDLSLLMRNVNKLVYEASTSNRYATFFYGEYDLKTRKFSYVNAGHNAPMILRGGEVLRLEAGGPVVGLLPSAQFEPGMVTLRPGDVFIAFTDGISEAMNLEDEEWEEERFIPAAQRYASLSSTEMIRELFAAADAFVNGAKQHDDMTLIVAKMS